jgi:hypothetical protein
MRDPVLAQNSRVYDETLNALHREYGDIVSLDEVREWLLRQGFSEEPIEPEPEFRDLPKTKFVKQGHPLEYMVGETSNIPDGSKFAVLSAYGERYIAANIPLTPHPARKSA